ncbi:SpaA isopeptide-forming pilin-related protein [Oscillospiraceae bacterium 21-37]
MKTTQKALSILLAVLLVFTCISTAWAAEVSSQLESAVESSVESTPPEESNPSSEPESGPESETPEPSVTPEATPSQEPTTAPAPVSDPYVEHFEIIDAEFGGEYVMVAPEAEDITQEFSRSHQALDIAAPAGSPVLAADEGTVTTVQVWDGSKSTEGSQSYGHMVQVKHPDGNSTLYAHLSEINVKQGQTVQRGQQIGRVGSTGNADGAHLHFEVLTSKGKVDPYPYLTGIELYARDPISKVESDLGGGSHYLTGYGVTRQAIVDELSAHEHDSYYLGTRYAGGDVQSPNGDTSYNGSAGMNCGGFVGYVLRKVGLDSSRAIELIKGTGDANYFGSGKPYDILAGASNYYQLAKAAGLTCYVYNTKAEMLADGKLEKGDIILMYWSQSPFNDGVDNHIGFYWGESDGEDILWHSSTEPGSGNQISAIVPKAANCIYIVIKIEPSDYNVTLTKTSADAECVAGNGNYSLAGATYNVYKGSSATGTPVATFTTDANGHAELSKPLGNGNYCVKETKAPKGYALDPKVYTFTINGADASLNVQDDPSRIQLTVQKLDATSGQPVPAGDASLAGAVYEVTYTKNGQTVTEQGTTNASGVVRFSHIPLGTVTVQEITPPPGYKLDSTIHTYTVTGDKTTTAVYDLTPTDISDEVYKGRISLEKLAEMLNAADVPETGAVFEVYLKSAGSFAAAKTTERDMAVTEQVKRGGIAIEKRDLESGLLTPLGGASLDGTAFEITNLSKNPVKVGEGEFVPGEVVLTLVIENGKAQSEPDALPYH